VFGEFLFLNGINCTFEFLHQSEEHPRKILGCREMTTHPSLPRVVMPPSIPRRQLCLEPCRSAARALRTVTRRLEPFLLYIEISQQTKCVFVMLTWLFMSQIASNYNTDNQYLFIGCRKMAGISFDIHWVYLHTHITKSFGSVFLDVKW